MIERDSFQEKFPFLNIQLLQARLCWSIRLRWLAILGYLLATGIAWYSNLNINYRAVWYLLLGLAAINLLYFVLIKIWKDFSFRSEVMILHVHIVVDLVYLMLILHYSGGIENPAFLFYVFHVVLSGILFTRMQAFFYAGLVIVLFSGMVLLESHGIVEHDILFDPHIYHNQIYVAFMIAVFAITVLVTSYICTGFMQLYRESKRIIDRQNIDLIEADKQKTAYFRFASHELKSPVIAVKSTLDVILKGYAGTIDSKIKPLLQRAVSRSDQMLDMISELLQLTNLRSNPVEEQKEVVDIEQLLETLVTEQTEVLQDRNITCTVNKTGAALNYSAVPDELNRVFGNLISNAIRYGKEGGLVSINLIWHQDRFEVAVQDDGIGISKEDQIHIFEEFFRSANARKEVSFGTGLGLSLVRQLVEKMEGKIEVQSELGKGTTFSVSLPIQRSQL